jgi:hypothetical protein
MYEASFLFSTELVNFLWFNLSKATNESVRFELDDLIIGQNEVNFHLLSFRKNENIQCKLLSRYRGLLPEFDYTRKASACITVDCSLLHAPLSCILFYRLLFLFKLQNLCISHLSSHKIIITVVAEARGLIPVKLKPATGQNHASVPTIILSSSQLTFTSSALTLSSHLFRGLPSGPFQKCFPTKIKSWWNETRGGIYKDKKCVNVFVIKFVQRGNKIAKLKIWKRKSCLEVVSKCILCDFGYFLCFCSHLLHTQIYCW